MILLFEYTSLFSHGHGTFESRSIVDRRRANVPIHAIQIVDKWWNLWITWCVIRGTVYVNTGLILC
jgi:hypothetical protein